MKELEHQPGGENDDLGHLSSPGESWGLEKPRKAEEQLGASPLEEARGGTIVFSAAENPALERQQDTAKLEKLERRREYNRKYYQQNRERVLTQKRERAAEKPSPTHREYQREYYLKNRERISERKREYNRRKREVKAK